MQRGQQPWSMSIYAVTGMLPQSKKCVKIATESKTYDNKFIKFTE